jgi:hypothetical protein
MDLSTRFDENMEYLSLQAFESLYSDPAVPDDSVFDWQERGSRQDGAFDPFSEWESDWKASTAPKIATASTRTDNRGWRGSDILFDDSPPTHRVVARQESVSLQDPFTAAERKAATWSNTTHVKEVVEPARRERDAPDEVGNVVLRRVQQPARSATAAAAADAIRVSMGRLGYTTSNLL